MNYDDDRIADAVLALLAIFRFKDGRSWKGFDFSVMDSLHERGMILDPKGKAKSVVLTEEGQARGDRIARELFASNASS